MSERIGVFGGTFDPIHYGHLIAAVELRHALSIDRVLFVPAPRPPHKRSGLVGSDHHRLAMVRLAITGEESFEVSTIEYERSGPSYTADTLVELHEGHTDAAFFLFLGEDALRDFPTWHQPERILGLAHLAVATRPRSHLDLDQLYRTLPEIQDRVTLVPTPSIGISATDLRARASTGRPLRYQTTDAVIDYIGEHGMYRTRNTV
ncbi:MAG TPA: nicotinate-nucleotide adenylyltransferase [Thermomicrobiales bacterium]|nr:nicotinate-nucleotide adenylyltransferase [Thermomicrobiales bacterium]